MHAHTRKDRKVTKIGATLPASSNIDEAATDGGMDKPANAHGPKLAIYYGSNAGTCKALAYKLRGQATSRGMNVSIATLNTVTANDLPHDRPVAIVTASYEGQVSQKKSSASSTCPGFANIDPT